MTIARDRGKNESVMTLIVAGAIGFISSDFLLPTYKRVVKNDNYLRNLQEMLILALTSDTKKTGASKEESKYSKITASQTLKKYPRSQILWDLIRLLNYAQLGAKYQEIERNDWLNITKKLELTI